MKLIVQIALGVFLGTLATQLTLDVWRARLDGIAKQAAEKIQAEQQRVRAEQAEHIRALLSQGRKAIGPAAGFVPDDAQSETQDSRRRPAGR
jgi:hypothetical protein